MTSRKRFILFAVFGGALLLNLITGPLASAASFKILYINSYHRGYSWSDEIEAGLRDKFKDAGRPFELSPEYLDTRRFPDSKHLDNVADLMAHKFADYQPDLIIVSDNAAFDFVVKHRERLFPGIPIVFCGYNNYRPEVLEGLTNITGVNEEISFEDTVEMALRVHPNTQTLVFITSTGEANSKRISEVVEQSVVPKFSNRFKVVVLKDASLEELDQHFKQLPQQILVFLTGQVRDLEMGRALTPEENGRKISAISPFPVYTFWHFHLNTGVIGGRILTGYDQGSKAADLALRVLGGERADEILVVMTSPSENVFDYNVMNRFGITGKMLPEGAKILNRSTANIPLTAEEKAWIEAHPKIVFGGSESWAPYTIPNADGTISGYDADIISQINQLTGLKITLELGKWEDMVEKAIKRELDGLSTSVVHKERAALFDFSDPYIKNNRIVLVKTGNPKNINKISDFHGHRIGVQKGNLQQEKHAKSIKDIEIVYFDNRKEMAYGLISGKIDFYVTTESSMYYLYKESLVDYVSIAFLTGETLDLVFSIRNDHSELTAIINKALSSIDIQKIHEIRSRWFGPAIKPPRTQIKKILIVGGDSNYPPSTFLQNGEPIGFQVDVIRAVLNAVDLKVRFELTPWNEALEKLAVGEIDVVAMSYSEKREKLFDFSAHFALNSFGLMVREDSNIKYLSDIKGKKILVQKGGVMREYIEKNKYDADITYLGDVENIIKLLANKQFEAAFLSKKTAFYIAKKLGISGLKFIGEDISPKRTVLGVKKGNYELVQLMNEGLSIIKASGELSSINEKWFGKDFDLTSVEKIKLTQEERAWLAEHPAIRLGFTSEIPPLVIAGENGEVSGILVDIYDELESLTGMKINIELDEVTSTIQKVKDRKIDGLLAATPGLADALRLIATQGMIPTTPTVYARNDAPFTINAIKDLAGKKIAVLKGVHLPAKALAHHKDAIEIVETDSGLEMMKMVYEGKVDAAFGLNHQNYIIHKHLLFSVKPVFFAHQYQEYGVAAIRADWPELVSILNKGLNAMGKARLNAINKKWTQVDEKKVAKISLTKKEQAWLNAHPVIRMGGGIFPPLDGKDSDGEVEGVARDYADLIARKLGIRFEHSSGIWADVHEQAKQREIDGIRLLVPNEERDLYLNFTRPYTKLSYGLVMQDSADQVNSLAELSGKKVATLRASYDHGYLSEHYPEINLVPCKTYDEGISAVLNEEVEAFFGALAPISHIIRSQTIPSLRLRMDVHGFPSRDLTIGIREDWPEFIPILDKAIASITGEEHNAINKNWIADLPGAQPKILLTPEEQAWLKKHPFIKVSNELDYPPFDFAIGGRPQGFSIDILNLLSERIGINIEYINGYTWNQLVEKFKKGELDLLHSLTKTPEREQFGIYSEYYRRSRIHYITRIDNPEITDIKELYGKIVAVGKGWVQEEYLSHNHPEIILLPLNNLAEMLDAISTGKAYATMGNRDVLQYMMRKKGLADLKVSGWAKEFDEGSGMKYYFMAQKNAPELISMLNKALDSMTIEEIDTLNRKWFGETKKESPKLLLTSLEQDWLTKHSSLNLGVDPSWAPLEFFDKNGKYSGIASSYMEAISSRLGIEMNPVPGLTWSQVIEKAKNKEIDILPAVVRTPAREKFLNFTNPYLSIPVVIATRNDAPFVGGLKHLSGQKVAVVKDYYLEEILAGDYPDLVLVPCSSLSDGLKALDSGEVDAFVDSLVAISYAITRSGLGNIKVAAPTDLKLELSMGVSKDSPELLGILNQALDSISDKEKETFFNAWMTFQVKYGLEPKTVLLWAVSIGGAAFFIIAFVLVWNRRMGREIKRRELAEADLQTSRSQLLNILGNSPIGVAFSTKGIFRFANPRFTEMFDVNAGDTSPDLYVKPGERDFIVEKLAQEGKVENYEMQMYGKGRQVRDILINYLPVTYYGEEGILGWLLDITERKKMEQDFQVSERKVMAMSKAVEDALVMIDGQGKVLFWNPAAEKLFGYSVDEAMGMVFHEIAVPKDVRDKARAGIENFRKTGQGNVVGVTSETTACNRQGKEFPVEVTVSSFQVDHEWFAVGTVRDITPRKNAEQKMRQHMEDLERFSDLATGREKQMVKLKQEINELRNRLGLDERYKIVK